VPTRASDATTDRLAALFRSHPAWVAAAGHLSPEATSNVYFTHRPGEAWRLEQAHGETRLQPGAASDPDFVFRFTPDAVERLAAQEGGIGEFAVTLFTCITADDARSRVDLRIVAGFARLARRGYVRLLLAAGPRVIRFGARHGIRTPGALRRFVAELRRRPAADWEVSAESAPGRPRGSSSPG
jgi:hypothetical protein